MTELEFDGESLETGDKSNNSMEELKLIRTKHKLILTLYNLLLPKITAKREINDDKTLIMNPKGIYIEEDVIKLDADMVKKTEIYAYELFDCYRIIEHENFENNEFLCIIRINKKSPLLTVKKNKKDLKRFLDENCFVAKSVNVTKLFYIIFDEYLNIRTPERVKVSKVLGFTKENGWTLPPMFELEESSEIQTQIIKNIKEVIQLPLGDVKEKFKLLHESIFVKYKDVCFAYAFIAPFFHALKSATNLVPFLIFLSAENDTAKTQMAKILTTFIYNHQTLLTSANCQSISRFGDYFTATTFPLAIDEVNMLKDTHIDILKSISTAEVYNTKKRADQSIKTHKPYQCSAILTCNSLPEIFSDPALLSRTLIIKFDEKPTNFQRECYYNTKKLFRPGEIFAFFYKRTRALTYEHLLKIYENTATLSELDQITDPRAKTIYRLLYMGKILCKRVFDIELDISAAINIIEEKQAYSQREDILQAFNSYILLQYQKHFEGKRDFSVKAQFLFRPNRTKADVIITSLNRKEMAKAWQLSNISHDMLKNVLKEHYKIHDSKTHKFEKRTVRGLRVEVPLSREQPQY